MIGINLRPSTTGQTENGSICCEFVGGKKVLYYQHHEEFLRRKIPCGQPLRDQRNYLRPVAKHIKIFGPPLCHGYTFIPVFSMVIGPADFARLDMGE